MGQLYLFAGAHLLCCKGGYWRVGTFFKPAITSARLVLGKQIQKILLEATMTFADTLKKLRTRAGKSRYRLAQYSGLNQTYILRLERGERANPTRDVVLMLDLGWSRVRLP